MRKIYTIMANGQPLMPEVMQGILCQSEPCCLVPIGSTRGNRTVEEDRAKAWNEARALCDTDIFLGMDSDVVLVDRDAVRSMVRELKGGGYDMVTLPTKDAQFRNRNKLAHSVFAVWRDAFPEMRTVGDGCVVCEAVKDMKIKCLHSMPQRECERA